MTRSLLIAFTLATSLAAIATCASAARAQSVRYCYIDRNGQNRCYTTMYACASSAASSGATCSAQ